MRLWLLVICLLVCGNLFSQTFAELKSTFEDQFQNEENELAAKTVEKLIATAKTESSVFGRYLIKRQAS